MWTLWILVLHNKYTLPQTTILSRYAFSNPFKVIFFYSCRVVGIAVLITNSLFVACKMFQLYLGTDVWISRGAHTRLMHLKGDSKFVREGAVTIFSIERLAGRNVTGANSNRPQGDPKSAIDNTKYLVLPGRPFSGPRRQHKCRYSCLYFKVP